MIILTCQSYFHRLADLNQNSGNRSFSLQHVYLKYLGLLYLVIIKNTCIKSGLNWWNVQVYYTFDKSSISVKFSQGSLSVINSWNMYIFLQCFYIYFTQRFALERPFLFLISDILRRLRIRVSGSRIRPPLNNPGYGLEPLIFFVHLIV